MALTFYTSSTKDFATGVFAWVSGTYKVVVMTSTYTFSAAHAFRSDLTNEVSGTNYSSGGMSIANKTASSANPSVLSGDDWPRITKFSNG